MPYWLWGTCVLSMDGVDFSEHKLPKIHVIYEKLRIRATLGDEAIF